MKKLFLCLAITLMAIGANAQTTWNVRVGGGVSSYIIDDYGYYYDNSDTWIGGSFMFAVEANMPLKKASSYTFSPSLMFLIGEELPTMALPLHFGYKKVMDSGLILFPKVGPVLGLNFGGHEGFIAGPSVELAVEKKCFVAALNGYYALTDVEEGTRGGIFLSVGYKF